MQVQSWIGNGDRKIQCSKRIVQIHNRKIHVHCRHVLWNHRVLLKYRHRMGILSMSSLVHGIQRHIYILGRVMHPMHCRIEHLYFGYQCNCRSLCQN